jgi:hypothetical protein
VAKTDDFMKELAEHEDEWVRTAAEARLGVKSTLEESRCARLLAIAELPWASSGFAGPVMPIPLRYAGTHTGRLSGEWKINMQNLPKAKKDKPAILRNSLEAPPGHAVVVADLGQIEARLTAWLSNSPLIEAFRQGTDVYKAMAASIFNTAETRVTENERFVGKAAVLGLGFGLGANNFYSKTVVNARMQGQDITAFFTQELAQKTVDVYRLVNKNTVRLWYLLDDLLRYEWMGRRDPRQVGPLTIGHGLVTGPGGLQMRYSVPYGPDEEKYPAYGEDIFYKYGGRPHKIYGAAFLENCLTADTQVLTINGWKPIVDVRTDEEVWDGQAWVHHNGVISRGYRTIGRLDGIGLTAEHEVMTSDGWIRAAQTQGFYWADIRVPDRFAGCWDNEPKEIMARSMCLWNRISSFIEYTKTQTLLWMQIRRTTEASQKSWNEQTSSILGVAFNVRPVSFANTPSVEKLWWPGHSRLQTVGKIRKFLGRYGANLQARINTGKVKEWPWLQFKKLYLGVLFGSSTQPPGLAHNFYPLGRYDRCRGSQKIEDWADDFTLPCSQRLAPRALVHSSTSEVFDLLNSGPRHCFVVRGRTGPRLVHNCIQFLARIIFFNAAVRIAKQGYPFASTSHDEAGWVVPEKDVDTAKELVHRELTTPPSWAPDLPLKASVSSGKSYGEAK